MKVQFVLTAIQHCNYCDEAGKYFNLTLSKKYPDIGFSMVTISDEQVKKVLKEMPKTMFPILSVCTIEGECVDNISGTMYKKDIEEFVKKWVDKSKEDN